MNKDLVINLFLSQGWEKVGESLLKNKETNEVLHLDQALKSIKGEELPKKESVVPAEARKDKLLMVGKEEFEKPIEEEKEEGVQITKEVIQEALVEVQSEEEIDLPFDYERETNQEFYLADLLKCIPVPQLYRIMINGDNRYYYEPLQDGSVEIYQSGTNFIKLGYPRSEATLNDWRLSLFQKGIDPDIYVKTTANFGTIMHALYGEFLMGKEMSIAQSAVRNLIIDLKDLKMSDHEKEVILYGKDKLKKVRHIERMQKSLLAFAHACFYYKIEPIAIEKMLRSTYYGVATAVDAILWMNNPDDNRKKEKSRIKAIWDFKSGDNFYPEHAYQLELNKRIVHENYPDDLGDIERIFNFSPHGTSKLFTLKDQTKNPELMFSDSVFTQAMERSKKKKYNITSYSGKIKLGCPIEINKYKKEESLFDILSQLQ